MKPKSKSKTFPKGTAPADVTAWVREYLLDGLTGTLPPPKVLITVTKYDTDKEEDK